MFRKKQNFSLSSQTKLVEKTIEKKNIKGGVRSIVSVRIKHPDERERFNEFQLEDLIKSGKKLEQVDTRVLGLPNSEIEKLNDVPRETLEQNEEPF